MYEAYVARTGDGLIYAFYYAAGNGVCQRVYEKGRWGAALSLAVEAAPGFVVSLGNDGKFYVLYRDMSGILRLLTGDKGGYQAGPFDIADEGDMHLLATDKGLCVLNEERGEDARLVCRTVVKGKEVKKRDFGGYIRTYEGAMRLQRLKDDHALLFYHGIGTFGYREMNMGSETDFMPIHVGAGVSFYSALTAADAIHFLYVVRSMLGSRLMYRQKHQAGLSANLTICEAPRIDGCVLFIAGNRIYAAYLAAGVMHLTHSDDGGASFRRPARYRSKLCESPIKAAYLTQSSEKNLALREVLVDSLNPWDVQILPEIYPDFYPLSYSQGEPEPPPQSLPLQSPPIEIHPTEAELYYGADLPEADKLRNHIEMLNSKLSEKDRQFSALRAEIETQRNVIQKLYQEKEQNHE